MRRRGFERIFTFFLTPQILWQEAFWCCYSDICFLLVIKEPAPKCGIITLYNSIIQISWVHSALQILHDTFTTRTAIAHSVFLTSLELSIQALKEMQETSAIPLRYNQSSLWPSTGKKTPKTCSNILHFSLTKHQYFFQNVLFVCQIFMSQNSSIRLSRWYNDCIFKNG